MTFCWNLSKRIFFTLSLLVAATLYHAEATAAQLTLTWTDTSTNEDGFKIARKTGTAGTYAQVATVGVNVTSYIDSSLTDGITYCYQVQAFNSAGASAPSNEACSTVAATSLTVTSTTQLTLTWTDTSTNEDGFKIARKTGSSGTYAQVATVGTNVTSYTDANLATGTTYCYQVQAFNSAGASAPSNEACSTTAATSATTSSTASATTSSTTSTTTSSTTSTTTSTASTTTSVSQLKVKIGVFRPSTGEWYLDLNGNGILDDCQMGGCLKPFGQQGDQPVIGDWAGTGTAQIGVFSPSTGLWKLDRSGNDLWDDCTVDLCLSPFGKTGDLPVVGHWQTTSGVDKIGFYRPSKRLWKLDLNNNGKLDACTVDGCLGPFGISGDLPVIGDWDGTGIPRIGVFSPKTGLWKLDLNNNGQLDACTVDDCLGPFGISGDLPVVGDWTGTGIAKVGVFDPSTGLWDLDLNGNGIFDGCQVDGCLGPFGQAGDLPVVGRW